MAGRSEASFHAAVDTLVGEIRDAGAEPMLYLTSARRDGLDASRVGGAHFSRLRSA